MYKSVKLDQCLQIFSLALIEPENYDHRLQQWQ